MILEKLKLYLQNNSPEKVKADWDEFEEYDDIGISVTDFVSSMSIKVNQKNLTSNWNFTPKNIEIENPSFASDFFLSLSLPFKNNYYEQSYFLSA